MKRKDSKHIIIPESIFGSDKAKDGDIMILVYCAIQKGIHDNGKYFVSYEHYCEMLDDESGERKKNRRTYEEDMKGFDSFCETFGLCISRNDYRKGKFCNLEGVFRKKAMEEGEEYSCLLDYNIFLNITRAKLITLSKKVKLIRALCYIDKYMMKRPLDKDISYNGYPETFITSCGKLKGMLGVSDKTVKDYIRTLMRLNVIYMEEMRLTISRDGCFYTNLNLYIISEFDKKDNYHVKEVDYGKKLTRSEIAKYNKDKQWGNEIMISSSISPSLRAKDGNYFIYVLS